MKLRVYANIRTGLVLSRKKAQLRESSHIYRALNLKNVTEDGWILFDEKSSPQPTAK